MAVSGDVDILEQVTDFDVQATAARFTTSAAVTVGALPNTVQVIFLGRNLAHDPGLHLRGLLELVPHEAREGAALALVRKLYVERALGELPAEPPPPLRESA